MTDAAFIREQDGERKRTELDAEHRAHVTVKVPASSRTWLVMEAP